MTWNGWASGAVALGPLEDGPEWGWQENGGWAWTGGGPYADFTVRGVTQRCRWIAPGTFQMGSPPDEVDQGSKETRHEVTLTAATGWRIPRVPRPCGEAVMGDNPSEFKDDPPTRWEQVSLNDVQDLHRPPQRTGARLGRGPACSEAQWENAAGRGRPRLLLRRQHHPGAG